MIVDLLVHLTQAVLVVLVVLAFTPARIRGRVACFLGLHSWDYRTELEGRLLVTTCWCARPGCPRYPDERIVDLEPVPKYVADHFDRSRAA